MPFNSIKDLVIDAYISEGKMPSYDTLTALVRENFPRSKWKESHYAWYKSQINTGRIVIPGVDAPSVDEADDEDVENNVSESINLGVSVERDLHDYLVSRLAEIEQGLELVEGGREYPTAVGRIDILARDSRRELVVIELKAGRAKDGAIGQLLGYMGCISSQPNQAKVRGILIASDFDPRVVSAARGLSNIRLIRYALRFQFDVILP